MQNKSASDFSALQIALNANLTQFLFSEPDNNPLANPSPVKPCLLLGLSGGLDSVVLLHLLHNAQKTLSFDLQVMHVHHGLSPNADQWQSFCQTLCHQHQLTLQVAQVTIDKTSGVGIEAEARKLRYNALFNTNVLHAEQHCAPHYVVTAHHQDDQAETLLLQLFRGAGAKGLSAMALLDEKRALLRPLLNVPRSQLLAYATQHQLTWCEDESNADTDYDRNYMRHVVLPVLTERFPSVQSVLARTALHMAETSTLLDDLAALDAEKCVYKNALSIAGLQLLSEARAKNLIRYWLAKNAMRMPNSEHLLEILNQCLYAKADANIAIVLQMANAETSRLLKRYQGYAYLCSNTWHADYDFSWQGEASLALPNGGTLFFTQVLGEGLSTTSGFDKLRITNRKGGERFKPDADRPTRTLKHLLQQVNMPPWQREVLPLIYWQDTLAYVPTVGACHSLKAASDEMGLMITWQDVAL